MGKEKRGGRWPASWPWLDRTLARPPSEKLAVLVIIGILFYAAMILLDNFVLRPYFGDVIGYPEDLSTYRERADWILNGKIPYLDFESESPPLVMFLFVVPQALGGYIWIYQSYFCFFGILTACAIYWGLRRYDDRLAFLMGLMYLFLPFGIIEIPLGAQDEAITVFFFLIPIILLLGKMVAATAFTAVLGALTKLFNILIFPWMLIGTGTRKEKIRLLAIFCIIVGIGVTPFLIFAPERFLNFPHYYLLANPSAQTGGSSISPWHFIDLGGFGLPGWAGVALTVSSLIGSTYLAYRWKMTLWEGSLFIMVAFFLFYPKILFVYFLMPVVLMLPYALEDRRVMWRMLAMSLPLFLAVCISGNGLDPIIDASWLWIVDLALSLAGWALFFQAWWITRSRKAFMDKESEC